jgi:hypothetical protein
MNLMLTNLSLYFQRFTNMMRNDGEERRAALWFARFRNGNRDPQLITAAPSWSFEALFKILKFPLAWHLAALGALSFELPATCGVALCVCSVALVWHTAGRVWDLWARKSF